MSKQHEITKSDLRQTNWQEANLHGACGRRGSALDRRVRPHCEQRDLCGIWGGANALLEFLPKQR